MVTSKSTSTQTNTEPRLTHRVRPFLLLVAARALERRALVVIVVLRPHELAVVVSLEIARAAVAERRGEGTHALDVRVVSRSCVVGVGGNRSRGA